LTRISIAASLSASDAAPPSPLGGDLHRVLKTAKPVFAGETLVLSVRAIRHMRERWVTPDGRPIVDRTKLREAKRSAELADPSSSARRTVEQARVSTSPRRDRQKPLFSSLEEGFIREKTRAVEDHRPWDKHTAEQFSSTAHMWRDIVGDRPVDEYTGIDAQLFRDTMLRMPSSRGQLSAVHVVRIPAVQQ
jgi:hypothetical protein